MQNSKRVITGGLAVLSVVSLLAAAMFTSHGVCRTAVAESMSAGSLSATAEDVEYAVVPYLYTYSCSGNPANTTSLTTAGVVNFSDYTCQGEMTGNSYKTNSDKKFKSVLLYFCNPTVSVPAHTKITYTVQATGTGKKSGGTAHNCSYFTEIANASAQEPTTPEQVNITEYARFTDVPSDWSSASATANVKYERTYTAENTYAFVNRTDEEAVYTPAVNVYLVNRVNSASLISSTLEVSYSYTVSVHFEPMVEDSVACLTLDDGISVNYMLDADYFTNTEGAYATLTYLHADDESERRTDTLPLAELVRNGDLYRLTATIAAGQLQEDIDLVLYSAAGEPVYCKTYSVASYCAAVADSDQSPQLKALCRALIDYGTFCGLYFGYAAENPTADRSAVSAVCAVDIPDQANYAQGDASGFSIRRPSFLALATSSVRIYYRLAEGYSLEDYTVQVEGGTFRTGYNGDDGYIEIYGITSVDLDKAFTLTVENVADGSRTQFTYSAMDFARSVILSAEKAGSEADATVQARADMFRALYLYHQAAKAFFGGNV